MFGFRDLDRILRGESTAVTSASPAPVRLGPLIRANLVLAAVYGICMGFFGLFARGEDWEYRQLIACLLKVPALFALTLLVTFPSLYVFNTLIGSRLKFGDLARLLTAATGILTAVLAGFGPIVAFFSVTTISYPFAILMNVVAFSIAGAFGIVHLYRMLGTFSRILEMKAAREEIPVVCTASDSSPLPRAHPIRDRTESRQIFYLWTVLFALVGAQMSWVLRPFIGSPNLPFTWFRPRSGSFFEAVIRTFRSLFEG